MFNAATPLPCLQCINSSPLHHPLIKKRYLLKVYEISKFVTAFKLAHSIIDFVCVYFNIQLQLTIILLFLQNSTFWPGLGESELFYSWAVSVFSISEIMTSLLAGYLSTSVSYIYLIPLTSSLAAMGGLMYALAVHGVMVIAARFLFGATSGFGLVLAQSYIGKISQEKLTRKGPSIEQYFLFYSVLANLSVFGTTGKELF